MDTQHEDIAGSRPCQRITDRVDFAGRVIDDLGRRSCRDERGPQQQRYLTDRPATEQADHLLDDDTIETLGRPRRRRQRAQLYVVAIASLSNQQQSAGRGNCRRRAYECGDAVRIVRIVYHNRERAEATHHQSPGVIVPSRAE